MPLHSVLLAHLLEVRGTGIDHVLVMGGRERFTEGMRLPLQLVVPLDGGTQPVEGLGRGLACALPSASLNRLGRAFCRNSSISSLRPSSTQAHSTLRRARTAIDPVGLERRRLEATVVPPTTGTSDDATARTDEVEAKIALDQIVIKPLLQLDVNVPSPRLRRAPEAQARAQLALERDSQVTRQRPGEPGRKPRHQARLLP